MIYRSVSLGSWFQNELHSSFDIRCNLSVVSMSAPTKIPPFQYQEYLPEMWQNSLYQFKNILYIASERPYKIDLKTYTIIHKNETRVITIVMNETRVITRVKIFYFLERRTPETYSNPTWFVLLYHSRR